jgi:hypothetical protein
MLGLGKSAEQLGAPLAKANAVVVYMPNPQLTVIFF